MCIHKYVYIYKNTYLCRYIWIYIGISVYIFTYICVSVALHCADSKVDGPACACRVCTHSYTCVCVYIHLNTFICVYMQGFRRTHTQSIYFTLSLSHTHTHTHIHTHTRAQTQPFQHTATHCNTLQITSGQQHIEEK